MKEISDKESFAWMCGKALLFIYSVSGVDLTYILRNQYSDSAKKELSAFLLKVVQSVFERFVQQDRIRYTELEELVYTTIFDKTAFDEAAEETANAVEIPITTYAQYLPVVDASYSADGEISNVFLAYLTELIQADSQEEWIQSYGWCNCCCCCFCRRSCKGWKILRNCVTFQYKATKGAYQFLGLKCSFLRTLTTF